MTPIVAMVPLPTRMGRSSACRSGLKLRQRRSLKMRLRSLVAEVMLLAGKAAAHGRAYAEHVEEAGGDRRIPQSFGQLAAGVDDLTDHVAGDTVEGRIQPNPVLQADRGDPTLAETFVDLRQLDEAIGIRVGQRAQEHGIDGGEDGAVGPDPQRQRQDHSGTESRRAPHSPQGQADVSQ